MKTYWKGIAPLQLKRLDQWSVDHSIQWYLTSFVFVEMSEMNNLAIASSSFRLSCIADDFSKVCGRCKSMSMLKMLSE